MNRFPAMPLVFGSIVLVGLSLWVGWATLGWLFPKRSLSRNGMNRLAAKRQSSLPLVSSRKLRRP